MLPGFLHRLLAEIRYLVEKPKYRKALGTKAFRIHTPPAKANCVAWLGGKNLVLKKQWLHSNWFLDGVTNGYVRIDDPVFKIVHLIN